MPSDQRNSTMDKGMHLIFSLFDVTSAQEVPFGIPQYVQYIFMVPFFVLHSSLLTAKSVNLMIAHDDFLFVTEKFPYWLL